MHELYILTKRLLNVLATDSYYIFLKTLNLSKKDRVTQPLFVCHRHHHSSYSAFKNWKVYC